MMNSIQYDEFILPISEDKVVGELDIFSKNCPNTNRLGVRMSPA